MKTVTLSGSPRANVGKTDATALRGKGLVPCVLYGNGEQIHFSADTRHFKSIIYTPETNLVEISINDKKHRAVLQEAQFDRISDALIHADFLLVSDDKPIIVKLPVRTIGQAEGVKDGGKLNIKMRKLKVRGLVSKLPDAVELNIEKIAIGKAISAGEIHIDGVTIMHPKNISVVSVDTVRAAIVEEVAPVASTAPAAAAKTAAAPAAAAPAAPAKAPAKK